jgi:hypothetical protein
MTEKAEGRIEGKRITDKLKSYSDDWVGRRTYRRQAEVCFLFLVAQDYASAFSALGDT